jgi:hypothetical protein
MAAMGDEENEEEGVSTLAEYMERVEEQELVRPLPNFLSVLVSSFLPR